MRLFGRRREPESEWVAVLVVPYPEGLIARGLLDGAGIEVRMERTDASTQPRMAIPPRQVRLLVREDDYDEAVALLPS